MVVCNSGGAIGSDTIFERNCIINNIPVNAFSYKTSYHRSVNKKEISDSDFNEGVDMIKIANKTLRRSNINNYINLLARNWAQVKYSDRIIAIGNIINPNTINKKGLLNKSKIQCVDGGTGYAVQMAIDNKKEVFVFEQNLNNWFKFSYVTYRFIPSDKPLLDVPFAGIGTRDINKNGVTAIESLFKNKR